MHAGSVDENDLPGWAALLLGHVDDSQDAVARGLRLGADDGELFADERIQQRGLAGVGASEDADETGMEGHGDRLLDSGCRRLAA